MKNAQAQFADETKLGIQQGYLALALLDVAAAATDHMASGDMLEPMGRIGGNIAVALRHISTLVGQAPQCA